jgi:hypothetical protein
VAGIGQRIQQQGIRNGAVLKSPYSSAVKELLAEDRLAPLGPGRPNESVRAQLEALTPEGLFSPEAVRDPDMATACLCALWLCHDFVDEAHRLCQDLETREGSYWHALVHRREPDFANSKYWFRRVGRHSLFLALNLVAAELARASPSDPAAAFLTTQTEWDPFAFVDLCQAASRDRSLEPLCRQIQQGEWLLLFDYCYQHASQRTK